MPRVNSPAELEELRKDILSRRDPQKPCVAVCGGTGCHALGNRKVISALQKEIAGRSLTAGVDVKETGCAGFCGQGPVVVVHPEQICYVGVTPEDAADIVSQTVVGKKVIDRLVYADPVTGERTVHESDIPFYKKQMRLLTGDNGKIDPKNIEDYLAIGGYSALVKALSMSPEQVVSEIRSSGLRGLGGAGASAAMKWDACRKAEGETKYIICNSHEGDPGSFADRRVMESNPHNLLEGMIIGAYAMGANEGYIFVGDEFPLTVENTRAAIKQAEEYGLLGKNVLGSGLNLNMQVTIDGGVYVCGESTAIMAAIEGRVGEPWSKYDHATEHGLYAKPTGLNNTQTWALVPSIINMGGEQFGKVGTQRSKGTRVFSLVGEVNNTGLVEVPMGMTLRDVIFGIGGGMREGKKFKAVLVGGPMGAFLPESLLDVTVDFDEFKKAGGSMGPSLIVMDENTCMLDMAEYFLTFLSDGSCGKCTPCREGLRQMLKTTNRIKAGKGARGDLDTLEEISAVQKVASLCGLGQCASSTLLSALKHFRNEFEAHIDGKRCPAGVCKILTTAGS
ncbi:MAG: NADH dehydrogenase [Chloroflexi bacterium RBG_16_57_8]|nr:MAG: NADH dehydrogenase [Chloroflexi bacterium RBG_16_57_8]